MRILLSILLIASCPFSIIAASASEEEHQVFLDASAHLSEKWAPPMWVEYWKKRKIKRDRDPLFMKGDVTFFSQTARMAWSVSSDESGRRDWELRSQAGESFHPQSGAFCVVDGKVSESSSSSQSKPTLVFFCPGFVMVVDYTDKKVTFLDRVRGGLWRRSRSST